MWKLIEHKNFPAILLLAFATALSTMMVLYRVVHSGYPMYFFLVWNIFLAWLPLGFSMYATQSKNKWIATAAFMAWLLFFPNSHYILTDIFHLRVRHDVPLWYDLLLLLLSSWTGAMLGFLSLLEIHQILRRFLSNGMTWLGISAIFGLESFGIYMGRYIRFNSWDILFNTSELVNWMLNVLTHPFQNKEVYKFTLLFTVFLMVSYIFLFVLIKPKLKQTEQAQV